MAGFFDWNQGNFKPVPPGRLFLAALSRGTRTQRPDVF
jgi:hypothetical protein